MVENLCSRGRLIHTVMVYSARADAELLVRCMRAGAQIVDRAGAARSFIGEALVRRRDEVHRQKRAASSCFVWAPRAARRPPSRATRSRAGEAIRR